MKKFVAAVLVTLMLITMLPMSAFAASVDVDISSTPCDFYNVIEKNDYNLAPGAVESEIVINDATSSNRNVVHVIEVDPSNPNITVMPTFKNISEDVDYTDSANWGVQELTKQAAHVENDLGLNVIGGMNVSLSWDFTYPYGLLIYNGNVLFDDRANHPGGGYLVITKDGKAELREAKAPLTGDEWMAQTVCFSYIVKDGKSLHTKADHAGDPAPRSVIGIKADGTLVLMMNDGRQAPYSKGFNNHEMANMMLALGCVDAINCDGGGSSTFITEREGTGELTMKSRPSDGAERATLTGILVVSKAVADGKFDHAVVETNDKYVTPESTVAFTANGADSSGGPADVPEDLSWQLADSSFGTIDDGVFVSNGKVGEVVVQAVYNGEVVGEASTNVVIPDSLEFVQANITAPYTKSVTLDVIAKYGYSDVTLKDGDVNYILSNEGIGTIKGNVLTATDNESFTEVGVVTATLKYDTTLVATANITLGRASQIVYDFESGSDSISNWSLSYKAPYFPEAYYFYDGISVADSSTGKVKNGNYALKVDCDGDSISCMNWCQTKIDGMNIDLTDAVSLSFWMYIPEGSHGYEWDFGNAIPVNLGHEFAYGTGWQYFTVPVSDIGTNVTKLDQVRLYHSDTNCSLTNYNHDEHPNYYADVVYYIDDITVNYSTAVEDFQAPIISNTLISHDNIDTGVAIEGQTIDANVISVTANAQDNMQNSNYTGINTSSAVVYVDGVKIDAACSSSGLISTGNITLTNGTHIFRFEISDNNGNTAYVEKSIVIAGSDVADTITYTPADATLKDVAVDSLVWMNLTATAIDEVSEVTVVLDLDNNNKWELDHMVIANGFEAEYAIDAESNDATITFKRTGTVTESGTAVLASLPIRVWFPAFPRSDNEDTFSYRLISVMTYVQLGQLTETDGNVSTFASDMTTVSTEYNSTRLTSITVKSSWHAHNAVAIEDVAPTCTTKGYTDRTFCEDCNSIVDWGTTVEATSHNYIIIDGKLACEDCKVVNELTGLYKDGDAYRYLFQGEVQSGWRMIGNDWYYFDETTQAAKAGTYRVGAVSFTFEEDGRLVSGTWGKTLEGTRYYYGPSYYYRGWYTIDGVDYLFRNGYRCEGIDCYKASGMPTVWYDFGEDGASATLLNGIFEVEGVLRYFEDGIGTEKGLVKVDGDYYYTTYDGKIAIDKTFRTAITNCDLPNGTYTFGADGKMIGTSAEGEIVEVDGNICYYVNGVGVEAGLVCVDGDYYYTTYKGVVATNKTINVSIINCDFEKGKYTFGADGKMIGASAEGEVVELDGVLYYYENGVGVEKGLVECDGDYYYAAYKGQLVVNKVLNTPFTSCDMPVGRYEFGADGKMINGIIERDGVLYYYENGVGVEKGLFEFEDNYYYAAYKGQLVVNKVLNTPFTSCDMPVGRYEFGADGKMINGIIERDGVYYYYENGQGVEKGLFEFEGNYYYAAYKGQLVVNKVLNTPFTSCDMPKGRYEFGADGKMLNGIVEKDGVLYYYENGVGVEKGLIEVDGDYYYAAYLGKLVVDKAISAPITNCDLPTGKYEFGADGKMLNGIVEKDGVLYYYENGAGVEKGLIEVDGDYYYAAYKGQLVAGKTVNAAITSCDLPAGKYEFGTDCKMLNGIVEKDGVRYYYENGQGIEKGLIYVDGYYYYAAYMGQLVVNKSLTVTNTNGLLISALYKFDELGRIVG